MATSKTSLTNQRAQQILDREEARKERRRRRLKRQQRQERLDELAAIQEMKKSLVWIQWSAVIMSVITVITFVAAVWTLANVKREVTVIQGEVNRIREAVRHPLETAGVMIGRDLDSKLNQEVCDSLFAGGPLPNKRTSTILASLGPFSAWASSSSICTTRSRTPAPGRSSRSWAKPVSA